MAKIELIEIVLASVVIISIFFGIKCFRKKKPVNYINSGQASFVPTSEEQIIASQKNLPINKIQLFTCNPFNDGFETGAYENLGVVSAAETFFPGFTDQKASVVSSNLSNKLTDATNACAYKIKNIAHQLGADAVIGLQTQTASTQIKIAPGVLSHPVLVNFIGTAVKKKVEPA